MLNADFVSFLLVCKHTLHNKKYKKKTAFTTDFEQNAVDFNTV